MKKSKFIFITTAMLGAFIGFYFLLKSLKKRLDDFAEEDLFDDDADLDFIDDELTEEPEASVKEEKPAKPAAKIRRGYIPVKLHKNEASA